MKTRLASLALALSLALPGVRAQTTAITYQGRLGSDAVPVTGVYDLTFALFNVSSGAGQVGSTINVPSLAITGGLFTVTLDFGAGVFSGAVRWLEIGVRTNGGGAFTILTPRQRLTSVPYAVTASNITGVLPAAALSGTYSSAVTLNNAGNSYSGSGANLTSLNANNLASGTVPDARLAPNIARTNQVWQTAGNLGTTPGTDFLGTRDNQALELKVNSQRALRLEPNSSGAPNVIGGSGRNFVSAGVLGATIGGGGATNYLGQATSNRVTADFATVAGGTANTGSGGAATVGGGSINTSSGDFATVAGGRQNRSTNLYATVGGGADNVAAGSGALVAGGVLNVSTGQNATVSGGVSGLSGGYAATVGGGAGNRALGYAATVGGGFGNYATGQVASVGGGSNNLAGAAFASIGGGEGNWANAPHAQVGGGLYNLSSGNASTVGGGFSNQGTGPYATVGGGQNNDSSHDSTTVGGGRSNESSAEASTVSGGAGNLSAGPYATVGGGVDNFSTANAATVAGGSENGSTGDSSTVGGGFQNASPGAFAAIGGGRNNVSSNLATTVAGGRQNLASGLFSSVGGGLENTNRGAFGTVPGGYLNRADGAYSFAAGRRAKADHQGAFVWADSQDLDFVSTGGDRFLVRAAGGVGIGATNLTGALYIRQPTGIPANGMAAQDNGLALGQYLPSSYKWIQSYGGTLILNPLGNNVGIAKTNPASALDVNGTVTATAFNPPSDRNLKENFAPVRPREVLEKVAALDITRWNFKGDTATPHLGPMAQDFHAAFGLGTDERHIATVDADGVALAAIQGLNQKVESEKQKAESERQALRAENAALKARLEKLERLLDGKNGGAR